MLMQQELSEGDGRQVLSRSWPAPGTCRVITDDPTDCWMAWEEAMSRYQAHMDINVRILMDCWDKLFLDDPSLDPPGREEAMKRALQRTEERKLAKECRKPSRRGSNGGR